MCATAAHSALQEFRHSGTVRTRPTFYLPVSKGDWQSGQPSPKSAFSLNREDRFGREDGSSRTPTARAFSAPTLYVANQGVTMKLRFGGEAVPT